MDTDFAVSHSHYWSFLSYPAILFSFHLKNQNRVCVGGMYIFILQGSLCCEFSGSLISFGFD